MTELEDAEDFLFSGTGPLGKGKNRFPETNRKVNCDVYNIHLNYLEHAKEEASVFFNQ